MAKHMEVNSLYKTVCKYANIMLLAALVSLSPSMGHAQFGGGLLAPPDALDTLSDSSVPSGGSFGADDFGSDDFGSDDFGSGDFGSGDDGFGGQTQDAEAFARDAANRAVEIILPLFQKEKTYPAYSGQRIYDAVSYRRNPNDPIILDTVRRLDISEEERNSEQYSDDGETLGDFEANDGVYARILPNSVNEYIGGESRWALGRTITLLSITQELDPLQFFGLPILATNRHSRLPQLRDRIAQQDEKVYDVDEADKLSGWSDTYLKDFRVDRDSPSSRFFSLYIPKPPAPPVGAPPPAPWVPFNAPSLQEDESDSADAVAEESSPAPNAGGYFSGDPGGDLLGAIDPTNPRFGK